MKKNGYKKSVTGGGSENFIFKENISFLLFLTKKFMQ